jgi:hypothetical protein
VPETESGRTRVRCRRAFLTAGPVAALLIASGGSLAHAAEAESAAPPSVSVSWTGPDGQPTGPGGVPVTTTTLADGNGITVTPIPNDTGTNSADATGDASSSVQQTLSVSILPGPLTVSPGSESVAFSRPHGQDSFRGDLAPVTVVDARGSLVGWDATVSLQSVAGLSASQLANARLCVDPDAVTTLAGRPSEVRSATRSCGRVGEPLSVFFAPPNGGGGTFSDAASLSLVLPATSSAGQVTASLAVAVH